MCVLFLVDQLVHPLNSPISEQHIHSSFCEKILREQHCNCKEHQNVRGMSVHSPCFIQIWEKQFPHVNLPVFIERAFRCLKSSSPVFQNSRGASFWDLFWINQITAATAVKQHPQHYFAFDQLNRSSHHPRCWNCVRLDSTPFGQRHIGTAISPPTIIVFFVVRFAISFSAFLNFNSTLAFKKHHSRSQVQIAK